MNYNYTHIMSKELTEKAIKMLLSGATLVKLGFSEDMIELH